MNSFKLFGSTLAVMGFALLGFQSVAVAGPGDPGYPDDPEPIDVGETGGVDADKTKIDATTGTGAGMGDVTMKLKNDTDEDVTDVHVEIIYPSSFKISKINTNKPGGSPFTENDPDGTGDAQTEASAQVPASAQDSLAAGDTVTVDVTVVRKDANGEWTEKVDKRDVDFEVWWTRGNSRNIMVSATAPDEIGNSDPRASIGTIASGAGLNLTLGAKDVNVSAEDTTCNDITLGECDGFQFQDGSFVLMPGGSADFRLNADMAVKAYDINGEEVSGTPTVSISELRIDDRGNFVFDLQRDPDFEDPIFLVITGLEIENIGGYNPGQELYAGVSGAAVAGHHMEDYLHLITFVE